MKLFFQKHQERSRPISPEQQHSKTQVVWKGYLWDVLPDAKVPCRSIKEMRAYLTNTFVQWAGYPIVKFWIDNHEDTIWTWVETPRGRRKIFFGYIEDIAHNIQRGFYESKERR